MQELPVEVGQQVTPGTNLARVAQPDRLKAVIRIAETQAKDMEIGQVARVDTRNGVIEAHVARIDPAAQNGTVTVDLALDGDLPRARDPTSPWTEQWNSSDSRTYSMLADPHRARATAWSGCSGWTRRATTPAGRKFASAEARSTPSRLSKDCRRETR